MQDTPANPYLEQDVLSSSPARLRWLLLQKATGLCVVARQLWDRGQDDLAAQWLLRLRDILGELLAGVRSTDQLAKQVADIYVFALKLLTSAEADRSVPLLDQLHEILEIERETWQLVVKQTLDPIDSRKVHQREPVLSHQQVANQPAQGIYQPFNVEA